MEDGSAAHCLEESLPDAAAEYHWTLPTAGAISFGSISFSGLAVASIVGIVLNAVLPGRRKEYMPNEENSSSLGKY